MKNIRFGLDIDGTVTDPAAFVPALNQAFNKQLTIEDITSYDLTGLLDISYDEFSQWMKKNEATIYEKAAMAEHAEIVIQKWATRFELYYVTARGNYLEDITKVWLEQKQLPYHHIELLGQHDKVDAVHQYHLDIFFEDKHDNAVAIAEQCSIPVILFDTPYNQEPVPEGVIRVKNWLEAEKWVNTWLEKHKGSY
ncbi:5' nucleotidase, NT5C type [Alkalicoccobacillus porphyridii]|uniref:Nucleotidase n=1 Tax=Alkalicoccobacillus porphyridii TaxID=2597270 RepID=A0A553ZZ78_9BACI|nr:hypothetical protein [Alkalicoccobacillus porphyridii]TSB46733.1 hypothetical protein FN960_10325 [Alkalicoccobacillus porphyridii]